MPNLRSRSFLLVHGISIALLMLTSVLAHAQQPPGVTQAMLDPDYVEKADRSYVAFSAVLNEFRSFRLILTEVGGESDGEEVFDRFPMTAQTYSVSFSWGTYITEMFRTELRYGTGVREDSFMNSVDVNLNYWLNWYIGGSYPITDYLSAYALYGLSHYDADVTRRQTIFNKPLSLDAVTFGPVVVQPDPESIHDDLFGTSFSTTWLLGMDLHLFGTTYLAMEYGRLLKDTETNIKVYQGNLQLRYEF